MNRSRLIGPALLVATWACCAGGVVLCFTACAGAGAGCTAEIRVHPDAITAPFKALVWLVRVVLKAMYPFLIDEP